MEASDALFSASPSPMLSFPAPSSSSDSGASNVSSAPSSPPPAYTPRPAFTGFYSQTQAQLYPCEAAYAPDPTRPGRQPQKHSLSSPQPQPNVTISVAAPTRIVGHDNVLVAPASSSVYEADARGDGQARRDVCDISRAVAASLLPVLSYHHESRQIRERARAQAQWPRQAAELRLPADADDACPPGARWSDAGAVNITVHVDAAISVVWARQQSVSCRASAPPPPRATDVLKHAPLPAFYTANCTRHGQHGKRRTRQAANAVGHATPERRLRNGVGHVQRRRRPNRPSRWLRDMSKATADAVQCTHSRPHPSSLPQISTQDR